MNSDSFSQLDRFFQSSGARPAQARSSLNFTHLGGREHTTDAGPTLEIVRHYPWATLPAKASLAEVCTHGWQPAFIDPRHPEAVPLEGVAFLDIETTGLSLGAGTVAFLVGIVHADREGLWLRQFLMRDFPEEPAQQLALAQQMDAFELVVTYNGGRFDLPILRTRAVINRVEAPWLETPHLDLLHPVRAVWRNVWDDCRLGTAESRLLGVVRDTDCEGWEVPLRYRQFLTEQNEEPLTVVLEHNAQDLLSLAGLTAVVQQIFAPDRGEFGLTQAELFGLARALLARGHVDRCLATLKQARAMGRLAESYFPGMRLLARLLKRRGDWKAARDVWCPFLDSADADERLWSAVEEAKAAEHRLRDFDLALRHTETALQTVSRLPLDHRSKRRAAALRHRRDRLILRRNSE